MHEMAATRHLLDIALHYAEEADANSITDIYVVIGQFSSMIDDSVQFYWDILTADTPAANSTIHFRRIPAQMQCPQCDRIYEIRDTIDFLCPSCSIPGEIIAGDEFLLEALDIEK